jgi:hypothetical protein
MPQVGFEPTIAVFEWAKTVYALDRVAGHCDRWKHMMADGAACRRSVERRVDYVNMNGGCILTHLRLAF